MQETGRENIEKNTRVVLEIGVGSSPHYKENILGKYLFRPDDQYVAFDIDEQRIKLLRLNSYNQTAMRGDALDLPFKPESVDLVILPDILNSIIVTNKDRVDLPDGSKKVKSYDDSGRQDFYQFGSNIETLKQSLIQICENAIKVLKIGGQLKIITRLSTQNQTDVSNPFQEILSFLKIQPELKDWKEETGNFKSFKGPKDSTIITATKIKPPK